MCRDQQVRILLPYLMQLWTCGRDEAKVRYLVLKPEQQRAIRADYLRYNLG